MQGLGAIQNIAFNRDNRIALRPHIGIIVNILQEHSSNREVMQLRHTSKI